MCCGLTPEDILNTQWRHVEAMLSVWGAANW